MKCVESFFQSSNNVTEEVIQIGDRNRERPRLVIIFFHNIHVQSLLFSVQWTTDTVDNENLGKKSSKCCCIYKKKKKWDEDSDSSDSVC